MLSYAFDKYSREWTIERAMKHPMSLYSAITYVDEVVSNWKFCFLLIPFPLLWKRSVPSVWLCFHGEITCANYLAITVVK